MTSEHSIAILTQCKITFLCFCFQVVCCIVVYRIVRLNLFHSFCLIHCFSLFAGEFAFLKNLYVCCRIFLEGEFSCLVFIDEKLYSWSNALIFHRLLSCSVHHWLAEKWILFRVSFLKSYSVNVKSSRTCLIATAHKNG